MKILALILGSLGVTVAICELLLAVFWHNPYSGTGAGAVVAIRTNARNLDQVHDRRRFDEMSPEVKFRTDDKGYILPSRQFTNPDYTVAFLGGSTTEMSLVAEDKRFSALVSTLLGDSGSRVNTFNAGRSGNTLHDSINTLFNLIALEQPDFVVVMHATNDQGLLQKDPFYSTRSAAPVTIGNMAVFTLQALSGKSRLFGLIRQAYTIGQARNAQHGSTAGDAFTSEASQPFIARLNIFVSMAKELGITPILMTQPLSAINNELTPGWANGENQRLFNNAIRATASDRQVSLVDLDKVLSSAPGFNEEPLMLLYDGMHATDRGSEVMAHAIADKLLEMIDSGL